MSRFSLYDYSPISSRFSSTAGNHYPLPPAGRIFSTSPSTTITYPFHRAPLLLCVFPSLFKRDPAPSSITHSQFNKLQSPLRNPSPWLTAISIHQSFINYLQIIQHSFVLIIFFLLLQVRKAPWQLLSLQFRRFLPPSLLSAVHAAVCCTAFFFLLNNLRRRSLLRLPADSPLVPRP